MKLASKYMLKNIKKGEFTPVFRREVTHFSGNDYRDLGKVIMEV